MPPPRIQHVCGNAIAPRYAALRRFGGGEGGGGEGDSRVTRSRQGSRVNGYNENDNHSHSPTCLSHFYSFLHPSSSLSHAGCTGAGSYVLQAMETYYFSLIYTVPAFLRPQ